MIGLEEILQEQIEDLQFELNKLQEQIAAIEVAMEEKPDGGLGRGDPAIARRELDRTLLERLEERAAGLREAIARLNQGMYGICEQCGEPIHPDRLAVLPGATMCIHCAQDNGGKASTSIREAGKPSR